MRTSFCFQTTKMSSDEDTELRDLVAQTLETNGVLGKIRVSFHQLSSLIGQENQKQFTYLLNMTNHFFSSRKCMQRQAQNLTKKLNTTLLSPEFIVYININSQYLCKVLVIFIRI